jgi:AraC family transcriptional regulator
MFEVSTGLSPHRYIVVRRVERAMPFPQGGDDLARAQVAARSRFRDQGHFTRLFQRLVGVTPKQFRRPACATRSTQIRLSGLSSSA